MLGKVIFSRHFAPLKNTDGLLLRKKRRVDIIWATGGRLPQWDLTAKKLLEGLKIILSVSMLAIDHFSPNG